MDEQQEPIVWQPTFVGSEGVGRRSVTFSHPADEGPKLQAGQRIPLVWSDGVTTLEVVSVDDDGVIELKRAD